MGSEIDPSVSERYVFLKQDGTIDPLPKWNNCSIAGRGWHTEPIYIEPTNSEIAAKVDALAASLAPKEAAISATRQSTYGAWKPNMVATSENMSGLYRQWQANNPNKPLPGWWAPLMQVAVKLNRIASGNFHQDNFDDARVYLSFVEQLQREEAACGGTTLADPTTDRATTPATGPGDAHEQA